MKEKVIIGLGLDFDKNIFIEDDFIQTDESGIIICQNGFIGITDKEWKEVTPLLIDRDEKKDFEQLKEKFFDIFDDYKERRYAFDYCFFDLSMDDDFDETVTGFHVYVNYVENTFDDIVQENSIAFRPKELLEMSDQMDEDIYNRLINNLTTEADIWHDGHLTFDWE